MRKVRSPSAILRAVFSSGDSRLPSERETMIPEMAATREDKRRVGARAERCAEQVACKAQPWSQVSRCSDVWDRCGTRRCQG